VLILQHPAYPTLVPSVSTPDIFFRNLPPVGGGQPIVRVRPVRLVKYTIETMYPNINPALPAATRAAQQGSLRIWRQTMVKGQWMPNQGRALIAENVKTLQFTRSTVTNKSILFTLSKTVLPDALGN
jgi:hypothetical protein